VALGRPDIDPDGRTGPAGVRILGASSDHLVVDAGHAFPLVGSEMAFRLNSSALLGAMTSPFVTEVFTTVPLRSPPA